MTNIGTMNIPNALTIIANIAIPILIVALTGCASQVPTVIEKPVVVEIERPVTLPADLLSSCSGRPTELAQDSTNGDLLMSWQGWQSYAACLESRLEHIRKVQPAEGR